MQDYIGEVYTWVIECRIFLFKLVFSPVRCTEWICYNILRIFGSIYNYINYNIKYYIAQLIKFVGPIMFSDVFLA